MKFVPNAVSAKIGRQILISQKHAPSILFVAGVAGMVATTILASKATLKVDEVLDKHQESMDTINEVAENKPEDYSELDSKKDKTYVYIRTTVALARLYAPAVLCGVASITMLSKSHNMLMKRNAALTAAYATLDRAFKDYRGRIKAELGEDREKEIYYDLEACEIDPDENGGGKKTVAKQIGDNHYSPYARLFDDRTSRSWSNEGSKNLLFLRCQQNYANDMLKSRGHLFLNEVYGFLGLDHTTAGAVVGWIYDGTGDNFVDFGVFSGDLTPEQYEFFLGKERGVWLDFNVDGVIYDKI